MEDEGHSSSPKLPRYVAELGEESELKKESEFGELQGSSTEVNPEQEFCGELMPACDVTIGDIRDFDEKVTCEPSHVFDSTKQDNIFPHQHNLQASKPQKLVAHTLQLPDGTDSNSMASNSTSPKENNDHHMATSHHHVKNDTIFIVAPDRYTQRQD
jgi:hypothetical protein